MFLTCPVCGAPLIRKDKTAVCQNRHSFDYAKSGYINLLLSHKGAHGDDPEMVKARTSFLETNAYSFLKEKLAELSQGSHVTVDLGCGEGYYTRALCGEEKYGFDLSARAVMHAAKKDKCTQYAVASIFHLPLADHCADTAVTCFAPVADKEIQRILKPDGKFILVTPGPRHLYEMKEVLYEKPYENPMEEAGTGMKLIDSLMLCEKPLIGNEALQDLFRMTPYYFKTEKTGTDRLAAAGDMQITCEFLIRIYSGLS